MTTSHSGQTATHDFRAASGETQPLGPSADLKRQALNVSRHTVGNFRITGILGQGGMGVVFAGERTFERLVQKAAIKVMPEFSQEQRARFLFEREVLARLQHPNIAAFIDAGESAENELWFAMELIQGKTILEFCDAHNFDLSARLHLFLQLCDAVSHSHKHLVLHRDIKPSNVLVNQDGQLKLIDFGIAKPLLSDLAQLTTDSSPMTPRYASPEQRLGQSLATSSDQWQLGALLYELLTGVQMRRDEDLRAAAAKDPPKASSRLKQLRDLGSNQLVQVALQRSCSADGLIAQLSGDLDAVIAMATRTSALDRYASVDELAHDLRAWQKNRPIRARRGERGYEIRQFINSNRGPFLAAAVGLFLLVSMLLGALLWVRSQARQAQQMQYFVTQLLLGGQQNETFKQTLSNAIDTVIAEQTLPVQNRIELLDRLVTRALNAGAAEVALRGAREQMRLATGEKLGSEPAIQARINLAQALARALDAKGVDEASALLNANIAELEPKWQAQKSPQSAKMLINTYLATAHVANAANQIELLRSSARKAEQIAAQTPKIEIEDWVRAQLAMINASEATRESVDNLGRIESVQARIRQALQDPTLGAASRAELEFQSELATRQQCETASLSTPALALVSCTQLVELLTGEGRLRSDAGMHALISLGRSAAKSDQSKLALKNYQLARDVLLELEGVGTRSVTMATLERLIGLRHIALKDASAAISSLERALAIAQEQLGEHNRDVAEIGVELARAFADAGQEASAIELLNRYPVKPLPDSVRAFDRMNSELRVRFAAQLSSRP